MGIFSDFANSAGGDLTVGALSGLQEVAQRDAKNNAVIATDSLNKENESFKITERAFDNKKQINNILIANPEAFGITPSGAQTVEMIADRLTNSIFAEQRSIFEDADFNNVKMNVARYLARDPGKGFELKDPYVPSENLFEDEQDKHAQKLSAISKMPRADKLLFNLKKIDEEVGGDFQTVNQITKVASISAKGYGILNTFPGTVEGNTNLNFAKTNIIVANAKAQFPNDAVKRGDFINKRLYENGINPLDAIGFKSPMTYKSIANLIDNVGQNFAAQIANNTAQIANPETTPQERDKLLQLNDQILLSQLDMINRYSDPKLIKKSIAGPDRQDVFTQERVVEQIKYTPDIDGAGRLNLPTTPDGVTRTVPIVDLIKDPRSLNALPLEVQNYVNTVKERFFDEKGNMVEPTREMFVKGEEGDIRFRNFSSLYNRLQPVDITDTLDITGYGFIQSPPKKEKSKPKKEPEQSKTFTYKGKTYNVPEGFVGKNIPEFLKKAIADQENKK